MNGQERRILLKLLSGPNAGAEMELRPGDWMLGSDEESDLVLLDAGIRAQHLLLHISPEGALTLTPKGGLVMVNGTPLPGEGLALPPFTLFTVGGAHICWGPSDASWPDLTPPPLVFQAEEKHAALDGETQAPPPEARLAPNNANKVGGIFAASPGKANKVGSRRGKGIALALLGVLAAFLLLDFSYFGLFFSGMQEEAAALTRSLHRRGYDKVSAVAQPDGRILVRGVVDSNARMDALVAYIENLSDKPDLAVASAEDLADALRARFKRADAALRVSRAGSVLRITGYIFDLLALEELILPEKEGLDLVPVHVEAVTWNGAKNELRTLAVGRGLEQKIRFAPGIYRVGLQILPLSAQERQGLMVFLRQADDFFGAESVLHVERWTDVPPPPPRAPAGAKILRLESTPGGALASGRTDKAADASSGASSSASSPQASSAAEASSSSRNGDLVGAAPDAAVMSRRFSCGDLRLVGEGYEMGVVLSGAVYRKGAKMPDDLQVRDVNPDYVVLQRGKVFIQICTARELAKE